MIVLAMAVLNLAMAVLFLSVHASFTHQERVVTNEGRDLCAVALRSEVEYDPQLHVGDLTYVGTGVAEGAYTLRGRLGVVRCTFDAPDGRDSLRVTRVEVDP